MNNQRPDNPFDAMRRVIRAEATQDDDGGFFAKLGGIDPEPDDDGPTAKGLFQHMDLNRNSYTYQYDPKIMPKKSAIDHLIDAFKAPFKPQPKRQPIVKVRREVISNSYGTLTRWNWRCNICGLGRAQSGWWIAMDTATRHAHNHH